MDRVTQDKILWFILVLPNLLGTYYLYDEIEMYDQVENQFDRLIMSMFTMVSAIAFARFFVLAIRIIPLVIEYPFAYYEERRNIQSDSQDITS